MSRSQPWSLRCQRRVCLAVLGGVGGAALLVVASVSVRAAAQEPIDRRAAGAITPMAAEALFRQYCVGCHNDRTRVADLSLEHVTLEKASEQADTWEKVVRKLRAEQMPPPGMPRPDAATAAALVSTIEATLDRAAAMAPNPGRPLARRLNRTEYVNAVRDLLGTTVDVTRLLPVDDTDAHGFDNNSAVLSISPALFERYMAAARTISRMAVGPSIAPTAVETYTVPARLVQDDRVSEQLPFGSRGGAAIAHYFPVDGEYAVTLQLQKTLYNAVRGLAEPHTIEVRLDRERIKTFTVGGKPVAMPPVSYAGTISWNNDWEAYANGADAGLEVRFKAKAGTRVIGVSFVKQTWAAEDIAQPTRSGWGFGTDEMYDGNPGLQTVRVEGPLGAGTLSETTTRQRIFTCRPTRAVDEARCARTILSRLARRAYRRPVTEDDLAVLLTFFQRGRTNGTFDTGIETALQRILVGPDFLFRIELDPPTVSAGQSYRISDLELATRLSFFLWGSIPDDQLLDLAVRGTLHRPAVLETQVRRMLADARSRALVDNFAAQWLQLRDLRNVVPDPDLYADFDENLREAFRTETELFLESQIRDDRSVGDLLLANYTFVNERLARHYGIPGVYGSRFRRIELTDSRRGGLLGHGSLLTITSYPNRTSPVLRGKWLLENLLGAPPPPPPPDVPSLSDTGENGERQSVRARLERHRRNPACASCHAQMDPLGFALEHFDGIGAWRSHDESGTAVDASAALVNGTAFEGLPGLRAMLVTRRTEFVATMAERLLSFALGRGIEVYDRPALRALLRETASQDHRWSALVLGIVRSMPFQMRRAES